MALFEEEEEEVELSIDTRERDKLSRAYPLMLENEQKQKWHRENDKSWGFFRLEMVDKTL